MAHDIFISYSRKNLDAVKGIKEELESLGFSCWMDLSNIPSGQGRFISKIVPAIKDTKGCFLFFMTAESQASEWAMKEIGFAKNRAKKQVVLVRIDDADMTDEFYFNYQMTDIIDWRKAEQKDKLLDDLRRWTGKEGKSNADALPVASCPICGKTNVPTETFRCKRCGRKGLCLRHQTPKTYLCEECEKAEQGAQQAETRQETGDAEQWFQRGTAALEGNSGGQNDKKALKCLRQAAEQGNAEAQFMLGKMYHYGQGVRQNDTEAAKWLEMAAEQGHADAQCILGSLYEEGKGVRQSDSEAAKCYRKAAEQGIADAQYRLGVMYQEGKGLALNASTAAKWYRKAAGQGHAEAQCMLGNMYHYGQGVRQNDMEAANWYQKAAEQGIADAQYRLGAMYQEGKGLAQNAEAAEKWYREAAKQGHGEAAEALEILQEHGIPLTSPKFSPAKKEQPAPAKKATGQGQGEAQDSLEFLYEEGKGLADAQQTQQKATDSSFTVTSEAIRLFAMLGARDGPLNSSERAFMEAWCPGICSTPQWKVKDNKSITELAEATAASYGNDPAQLQVLQSALQSFAACDGPVNKKEKFALQWIIHSFGKRLPGSRKRVVSSPVKNKKPAPAKKASPKKPAKAKAPAMKAAAGVLGNLLKRLTDLF